jgi:hypothetical protein
VLQSAFKVHTVGVFVNEHGVSIGISNAVTGPATILGVIEADRFVVGLVLVVVAVAAVVVVAAVTVVVVDVVLVGVVEVDVDADVVDDKLVPAATADAVPGCAAAFDGRAASAGTLLVNTGSSRIGAAARTVTMRRLIEPRFGRARPIEPADRTYASEFIHTITPAG